jgi:hypothetical protein
MLLSKRDALIAILLCSFPGKSRADVSFAPAGELFSAKFPIEPEKKRIADADGGVLTIYGSREGRRSFAVAHALWPQEPNPVLAMQSIMDGLIERVSAELLSIERISFVSEDGRTLIAKRFTYGSSKLWGGGISVAVGRHTFLVQVTKPKPSEGFDSEDDQFISSFKVLG